MDLWQQRYTVHGCGSESLSRLSAIAQDLPDGGWEIGTFTVEIAGEAAEFTSAIDVFGDSSILNGLSAPSGSKFHSLQAPV